MDTILLDYQAYYQTRMKRYEDDAHFTESYLSEKALFDCISSATSMEDLMQSKAAAFRDLSVKNGVALVTDQTRYKLHFYQQEKETIQAKGQKKILDQINAATDAMQIVSIVSETQHQNTTEVLVDNMWPMHFFSIAIPMLQQLEVLRTAVVPDNFKNVLAKQYAEVSKLFIETSMDFLSSIRNQALGWQWDHDILWEYRHRKKCPLPDAVLQQRIDEHKFEVSSIH